MRVPDGTRIQLGRSVVLKYVKLDPYDAGFHRELFERSVRDSLTGLYNRSYFLDQVGPLADRTRRGISALPYFSSTSTISSR